MGAPKGNKFAVGNEGGAPRLWSDPVAFAARANEYFETDGEGKTMPSLSGIALFMGFNDRESFSKYGEYEEEFARTVKRARLRIEKDRQERLLTKEGFTPGVIFDLKNNHGWKDKSEHEVSGPNGGPIATVDAKKLTKAQLEALASIRIPADSR